MLIEGVDYEIDWGKFPKGSSFFIPCLGTTEASQTILAILKRLNMRTVTKVSIEDGVRGIRIWRV